MLLMEVMGGPGKRTIDSLLLASSSFHSPLPSCFFFSESCLWSSISLARFSLSATMPHRISSHVLISAQNRARGH